MRGCTGSTLMDGLGLMFVLGGILLILVVGLIAWEFWLAQRPWVEKASLRWLDYVLLTLLLVAALASGLLVAYSLRPYGF